MFESIEEQICKLNELTVELHQRGEYSQADVFATQALNLALHQWGDEHPDVAISLNNLASIYQAQGRYSEAKPLYEQALNLVQSQWGDKHPDVLISLRGLAVIYQAQGRYNEAEPLYQQTLELWRRQWGDEHPYVAMNLNSLATLYHDQGRYSEAEPLFKQALNLRQRWLGDDHPDLAQSLNSLALLYHDQGRYSEAEPLLKQALDLLRRQWGDEHPDVAVSLHNLASLYKSQGRYSRAEPIYERAVELWRRQLGNEHPYVGKSLNNLALLYCEQGRYTKAEPIYEQAVALLRRQLGNEHPDVATSLNNLALLYQAQGRYNEAESLYEQALALRRSRWGDQHPDVATSLNNLAFLYNAQGRYSKAEPLFKQALALRRRQLGDEHPDVAQSLNNLAMLYQNQGRYSEAEPLLKDALELYQHQLGDEHPCVATSLRNLAGFLVATNRPAEALAYMIEATQIENCTISQVFATSSEDDRLAYLQTIRGELYGFLSLIYEHLTHSTEAVQAALDVVLKRKALTAESIGAQNEALSSGRYPHLTFEFQQLRSLSDQIVHLTFSSPKSEELSTYQQNLAILQAQYDQLRRRLASQVPEIQLKQQLQTADSRTVAIELPEGTTLVEFVYFYVHDPKPVPTCAETKWQPVVVVPGRGLQVKCIIPSAVAAQWQPARYLAFILPAKQPDQVQMIDLGEAAHIDRLIQVFRESVSPGDNYAGDQMGMRKKKTAPTFNRKTPKYQPPPEVIELYQAIFNPIRPYLGAAKQLLLAPDGNLNLVPFKILPTDETGDRLLMDEYNISYLSVGRDILRSKIQTSRLASQPLIIADPDFDLKQVEDTQQIEQSIPKNPQQLSIEENLLGTLGDKEEGFPRVIGTRLLGESVAQMLKVPPLLDKEALESRLKTCQSPSILLIATHGVFFSHSPSPRPSYPSREHESFSFNRLSGIKAEDPMLRSALALAGANTWVLGGKLPEEAGKGLVFAQDVAALDLWATELAVLSACNTAIGDIKIGEGVFGLRRAFAVAGAKTLVMSLWSVPDRATALLMERFFTNLQQGLGRADALQDAQNYIRTITVKQLQQSPLGRSVLEEFKERSPQGHHFCDDDKPLEHPYFWGAWVCQGDTTGIAKLEGWN